MDCYYQNYFNFSFIHDWEKLCKILLKKISTIKHLLPLLLIHFLATQVQFKKMFESHAFLLKFPPQSNSQILFLSLLTES